MKTAALLVVLLFALLAPTYARQRTDAQQTLTAKTPGFYGVEGDEMSPKHGDLVVNGENKPPVFIAEILKVIEQLAKNPKPEDLGKIATHLQATRDFKDGGLQHKCEPKTFTVPDSVVKPVVDAAKAAKKAAGTTLHESGASALDALVAALEDKKIDPKECETVSGHHKTFEASNKKGAFMFLELRSKVTEKVHIWNFIRTAVGYFFAAIRPRYIRMWTAAQPCQYTKAMLGWYQSWGEHANVRFAYLPALPDENDINDWRTDLLNVFPARVNAINAAAAMPVPLPNQNINNQLNVAHANYNWDLDAQNFLAACYAYLALLPHTNGMQHDAASQFITPANAGNHEHCAMACGFAHRVGHNFGLRSCSVAIAQVGVAGPLHNFIALSGNAAPAGAVAGVWPIVNAAGAPTPQHPNNDPAWLPAGTAFPRRSVPQALAPLTAAHRNGYRTQWLNAVGAPAPLPAHAFPGFVGTCSEDRILYEASHTI